MKKKDIKKEAIIKTVLIIGIIIAVNILGTRIFTRLDLTKHKTYTLSDVSKEAVSTLPDRLVVKAYFSDNLPPPYNNVRRQVRDMLDDYRSFSNGNFNYEFYNPIGESGEEELQKEAEKYGINPVQVQVVDKDKLEVKNAFLGMVFLYGGKQETLPLIQSADNLEYEITTTIRNITTDKRRKIGFLQGQGEYSLASFEQINSILTRQYEVMPVSLSLNNPVPEDIEVLVIAGPKEEFKEDRKYILDQYIMRGGRVIWLINKISPNFQQQIIIGEPIDVNIDDMMQHYGLDVKTNLIRDLQCAPVQVRSPMGFPISINYPYFPLVTNIDRELPSFAKIQSITLSFASSIDTNSGITKGLKVTPLLKSSNRAGIAEGFFILNLEQFQNMTPEAADTLFNKSSVPLGAIYEGNFTSFYEGKPIPVDTVEGSRRDTLELKTRTDSETKMIVIGDSEFMNEQNRPPVENLIFLANMVDYMMDDAGMSEIKSKTGSEAPIEEVSEGTKSFIKYFSLFFPPAIVLLVGLYVWNKISLRRKALKNTDQNKQREEDEQ